METNRGGAGGGFASISTSGSGAIADVVMNHFPSATKNRRLRLRFPCLRPKRSEEHTSELQSPCNLVCRLLLEKKTNLALNADGTFTATLPASPGDAITLTETNFKCNGPVSLGTVPFVSVTFSLAVTEPHGDEHARDVEGDGTYTGDDVGSSVGRKNADHV